MEIEKLWQNRWSRWGMLLGGWTLFGLFLASQLFLAHARHDLPVTWYKIISLDLGYAYVWATLTPSILGLARRFPIERKHWARNFLVHIFASFLVGIATRILHDILYWFFLADTDRAFSIMGLLLNVYLIIDYGMMIYWLILLISHAFNYYRRYREGESKSARLEALLARAELQALKMQLHPHFLFNTLHSISALLYKDVSAADKMIARLGDFLRITLENSGSQEVSLAQELEFLKCYLEIERLRFQDRLTVCLDIDARTLSVRVPNLILQPIVENAIRHGIAPRSCPGRIEIHAKQIDGFLQVRVSDNGPGLPVNGNSRSLFKKGLGLANTQARLQQIYGPAHRLDFDNAPAGGLIVTIEIPVK
ncbi:MAG: histidine kinase [Blastocatellia bacterium]|nr:histidine kinase [Blastocatellia bacterium]